MTQTIATQSGAVRSKNRSGSSTNQAAQSSSDSSRSDRKSKCRRRRRHRHSAKSIERKLSQKVDRSSESVDMLVDEVLLTGDRIGGGIQEALDDLMGYDTEYAEFLLARDEKERKHQAHQEKLRRQETPLQRQQRLMREARMATRKHVRNELYRDDRTPTEKIRDAVKSVNYRQVCKKLHQHGLLVKPWQGCTLLCLFVLMLTTNIAVFGKGTNIKAAPDSYTAYCTNCNHKYEISRQQFEEYTFYDVHPEDYHLQYHKKHPDYPVCPECKVIHQKLILVSRPDRDERFLLATNQLFKMPIDRKGMEELCNKYQ